MVEIVLAYCFVLYENLLITEVIKKKFIITQSKRTKTHFSNVHNSLVGIV